MSAMAPPFVPTSPGLDEARRSPLPTDAVKAVPFVPSAGAKTPSNPKLNASANEFQPGPLIETAKKDLDAGAPVFLPKSGLVMDSPILI